MPVLFFFFLLISLLMMISGCVTLTDPESTQEYRAHSIGAITETQSIGQTFVSRRPRLENIQIWYHLDPSTAPNDGKLIVELYHNPDDSSPIKTIPIGFGQLINRNEFTVPLSITNDPANQSYYIHFKVDKGTIHLYGRDEDAYPQGQVFINNNPQDSDISFRLSYDYDVTALLTDIDQMIRQSYLVIPLLLLLWLPGRLLLGLLGRDLDFDAGEKFAISIGLSLAIIPLIMLWTSLLNLHWSKWSVVSIFLILALFYILKNRGTFKKFLTRPRIRFDRKWITQSALIIVFFITLTVRFSMVRDMAAPAWVDSVHHAMITNLIVENGGYPDSYAPFLDIGTANYHPGFHSNVAVFQWLTEIEIQSALLLLGQVLNALSVFSAYLLTKTLTNSRFAGIFAALAVGLLTPMPAYYTSWGRYTQLAGLLILPAAFSLFIIMHKELIKFSSAAWGSFKHKGVFILAAVTSVAFGGLFLTHYRVIAFLMSLVVAYLFTYQIKGAFKKNTRSSFTIFLVSMLMVGTFTILFTLPWWPNTLSTLFIPRLSIPAGTPTFFSDFSWAYLTTALGSPTMILAGLGLLIGLIQRKSFVITTLIWVLLMFFIANLGPLGLPGSQFVNNSSVTIMLFMPISVLAGYFIAWLISIGESRLINPWRYAFWAIVGFAGIFLSILGAKSILPILNLDTMLFRNADYPALSWVEENTPLEETILINPFSWGYGMYAGRDGGYWITPLAYRKSIPPPVLYGFSRELSRQVNQVSKNVISLSDDINKLHAYLWENDIRYVFIGARGGALSPRDMMNSPSFELLYNQDGAWVFHVLPPPQQ